MGYNFMIANEYIIGGGVLLGVLVLLSSSKKSSDSTAAIIQASAEQTNASIPLYQIALDRSERAQSLQVQDTNNHLNFLLGLGDQQNQRRENTLSFSGKIVQENHDYVLTLDKQKKDYKIASKELDNQRIQIEGQINAQKSANGFGHQITGIAGNILSGLVGGYTGLGGISSNSIGVGGGGSMSIVDSLSGIFSDFLKSGAVSGEGKPIHINGQTFPPLPPKWAQNYQHPNF